MGHRDVSNRPFVGKAEQGLEILKLMGRSARASQGLVIGRDRCQGVSQRRAYFKNVQGP